MKTLILYSSKTGFTKNYAKWLSEEIDSDMFEIKDYSFDNLSDYTTIIYGGGLYAGGINGIKIFKKHFSQFEGKKILLFFCGASPSKSFELSEITEKNFTTKAQAQIKFFYLRGGFDYSKLNLLDKILMKLLKFRLKSAKKKRALTPDEKGMLEAYQHPVNFTKKEKIQGIIDYLKL